MLILKNINNIEMNFNDIKRKIGTIGGALVFGKLLENFLKFSRNIILVRILAPEDFGIMAILMASTQAIEAFAEVGLRQSLIQNKSGHQPEFLNIVWFLGMARGFFLYIIGFSVAPIITTFYNKPEFLLFIRIGFATIMINSLISPRVHLLEKELRFKEWIILMQSAAVIGITGTIIFAFVIQNVWALLIGFLLEPLVRALFSFIFYPIKPNLQFDISYFRQITKFSRSMFGLPILAMIFYQVNIFAVGKLSSIEQLGIYVIIFTLAEIGGTIVGQIVNPIFLPVLAMMQDNKQDFKKVFIETTRIITIFLAPLTAVSIIFAQPILNMVYGQIYGEYSIPFSVLIAYSMVAAYFSLFTQVFFALGQPNRHRIASFARTIIFVLIIFPATKIFSLTGASVAILTVTVIGLSIQTKYMVRLMNLSFYDCKNVIIPGIKITLILVIPGIIVKAFVADFFFIEVGIAAILCLIAWVFGLKELGFLQSKKFRN
jgi:lipopolysaccharide exporter